MKRVLLSLIAGLTGVVAGCVDNEESFFVEHMKKVADAPDCSYSTGDAKTSSIRLAIPEAQMFDNAPEVAFLVTNAIMSQEDGGTLKAESNGVFVDGYELYTVVPGEGALAGTEYFTLNDYIPPESQDVLFANVVSRGAVDQLSGIMGCPDLDQMGEILANVLWAYGKQGGPDYAEMNNAVGTWATPTPAANASSYVYSVIKFKGHTQGGKPVESQEFSVKIELTCSPQGGWGPCFTDPCESVCNTVSPFEPTCGPGVNSSNTCIGWLNIKDYSRTGVKPADGRPYFDNAGTEMISFCDDICQ